MSSNSINLSELTVNQCLNNETISHPKCDINDNKRLKSSDHHLNDSNHFTDSDNENQLEMNSNHETKSQTNALTQFELITNEDLNSSENSSQTLLNSDNTIEDNLSEKSIELNDEPLSSQSLSSDNKSFNLLETEDESDSERSPLHQLVINTGHDRQALRSSQSQLITDEDLQNKTQNSQTCSNSSQNSIFSFYEY